MKLFFILLLLIISEYIILLAYVDKPPSRAEVSRMFDSETSDRKVLAYVIWNNKPYILFSSDFDKRIYFDKIKRDYKYLLQNGWVWTAFWYYLDQTTDPASLGVGYCTGEPGVLPPECKSTDIFGQINDKQITVLELDFNGMWNKYTVAYPGFAIRLNNFNGTIEKYRFLNDQGQVILESNVLQCNPFLGCAGNN